MNIGETLKQILAVKEITLGGLSKKSGIGKSYLSKICNNKRTPSIPMLVMICKNLDINLTLFFGLAEYDRNSNCSLEKSLYDLTVHAMSKESDDENKRI